MAILTAPFGAASPARTRRISPADLGWALRQGWRDFKSKRGDVPVLLFVYPAAALLAALFASDRSFLPLVFPIVAGLAILGPLIALGYYEVARRPEGGAASWRHFLEPFRGPGGAAAAELAFLLLALFALWVGAAALIYQATLGRLPLSGASEFFTALFNTSEGWTMILVGNLVGAFFALLALAVSFVSLPYVVDRRGHAIEALVASVEAFAKNAPVVIGWGVVVAVLLLLGTLPLLVGLPIVLPVLGYATWRLYTRVVEPAGR